MKQILVLAVTTLSLISCSSSAPVQKENSGSAPVAQEKPMTEAKAPAKSAPASAVKPVKCTYDTDCMVQNSCVNEKCKLTGNACRFRSDCPSPRGTCIDKVCHFN